MSHTTHIEDRTAAAVLDAAAAVLATRSDASMAEIAGVAGVTRTTLYRHFASREALVQALAALALKEAAELIEKARLETVPVEEGLARLVRAFLSVGDRYLVLVHEQVRLEPAEVERALAAPTRALLERGQREGRLSQDHPVEWLMEALGGLLRAALRHSAAADLGVEAAAAAVITLFLDGAAAR